MPNKPRDAGRRTVTPGASQGHAPHPPPQQHHQAPVVPLVASVSIHSVGYIDCTAQKFVCELSLVCTAEGLRGQLPAEYTPGFCALNCLKVEEEGLQWRVEDGADVRFGWRLRGVFAQQFDLSAFPFDSQVSVAARDDENNTYAWVHFLLLSQQPELPLGCSCSALSPQPARLAECHEAC